MLMARVANRWRAFAVAGALFVGVCAPNVASADPGTYLGDITFTFASSGYIGSTTNPGGGGPFIFTDVSVTPSAPAGIGSSVRAWCAEIAEEIGVPGTYTYKLYLEAASRVGGLVKWGLDWFNLTPGGFGTGTVTPTAAGSAAIAAAGFGSWNAVDAASAVQEAIWVLTGNGAAQPIAGHAADTGAFLTWLENNAPSAAYYRLVSNPEVGCTGSACQDQLVAVPGPILGAGLPGLLVACGGLIALARRRRRQMLG
jgi:hypothetical protein